LLLDGIFISSLFACIFLNNERFLSVIHRFEIKLRNRPGLHLRKDFKLINSPQEIRSECNQLTVINTGAATAVLNGVEIAPGDQYVSPGNENELNLTRYRLSFAGVGTNQVVVIRKIYQ
jgi:hypothetical protein